MANNEVKLIISADGTIAVDQLRKVAAGMQKLGSDSGSLVSRIKAHWLGITAAITGTAMLLNKAWSLAEMAAGYEEQMTALNRFAATYNTTASSIVADIKEITNGQIAMVDIAKISSKALALNVALDKYKELAKYADAVGDALGMSTTQALETLTEAAEKGTSKVMKQIVGVVDLEAKYGKLTETMTDQQKVTAMTDLLIKKLKNTYGDLGSSVKSTADKMEQLTATVKDMQLHLGSGLIRAAFGAAGAFQWLAAGALNVTGAIFQAIDAFEKFTGIGKETTNNLLNFLFPVLGIIDEATKKNAVSTADYGERAKIAYFAAMDLTGKAVENFKAMTASSADLAKAMAPPKPGKEDENKKRADEMKLAMMDWKEKIDALNPSLEETDKQLMQLEASAGKLTEKWGKQKWISEGLEKGKEFINIQEAERQFDVYAKLKEEQRNIDKKYADETASEIMKLADERLEALSDSAENTRKVYSDIAVERETINKGELAGKIKQYDVETTEIWRHAQEIIASHELTAEQILAIYDEASAKQLLLDLKNRDALLASNGTLIDGLNEGFKKYVINLETSFQQGLQIAQQVTAGMENAFMGFFDYTSKEFLKWGSLVQNILHEVYKAMVMTQIVKPIVGGITNLFAPSTSTTSHEVSHSGQYHSGGLIMHEGGYIPRFHSGGFSSDEVPAILQRGEYVVSRRGVAAMDAINQGNVSGGQPNVEVVLNVQNNTGMPVQAREGGFRFNGKQMVKEIILELKRTDPGFNAEMARG